ncbi:MAG: hypothetical protein ACLQUY_08910 [Ktedonobacterales bacterium]
MKLSNPGARTSIKPMPILIGSGDQTYGVVTLEDSGTLEIAGDAGRITRLLARIRRSPGYRELTIEEFFASIPEALGNGRVWAAPLETVAMRENAAPVQSSTDG